MTRCLRRLRRSSFVCLYVSPSGDSPPAPKQTADGENFKDGLVCAGDNPEVSGCFETALWQALQPRVNPKVAGAAVSSTSTRRSRFGEGYDDYGNNIIHPQSTAPPPAAGPLLAAVEALLNGLERGDPVREALEVLVGRAVSRFLCGKLLK